MKGVTFGLIGWVFMNLIFFPLIGLGPLAIRANAGFGPVLLSLVMLQTYSVVLGTVYAALGRRSVKFFRISSQDDRRANY